MSKVRRSFTPEDRYSIVQEAIRDGHAEVCRKYDLLPLNWLTKGGKDSTKKRDHFILRTNVRSNTL